MWQCSELTRLLAGLGWKPSAIEDLQVALWCVHNSGQAAEDLCGSFVAYGCMYHSAAEAKGYARAHSVHPLLRAAAERPGGPQTDPDDETLPLFGA